MPFRITQRCREQMDQCRLPSGDRANTVCHKMPAHYAWECPNCGRTYEHEMAWQFADSDWFWDPDCAATGEPLTEGKG